MRPSFNSPEGQHAKETSRPSRNAEEFAWHSAGPSVLGNADVLGVPGPVDLRALGVGVSSENLAELAGGFWSLA
jgi:hypothetical protein